MAKSSPGCVANPESVQAGAGFQNQRTGERLRRIFALKNEFWVGPHLSHPFGYDFHRMTNCEQVKLVNGGFADYQRSQHFGLRGNV